jgi:NAD(P)-dependent dehydrogenase (short-subunit alcohol dehydrogenase family)
MNTFTGAVAAITGAADGIGLGLARSIGRRGGKVALLDIRGDAARDAAGLLEAEGIEAISVWCDVTERTSVNDAAKQVADHFGGVNLAWMNAGVGASGHVYDADVGEIEWVNAVNVHGVVNTVRAFWPLVEQAEGLRHLAFTGSSIIFGQGVNYPHGIYASSKWASVGVAESLVGRAEQLGIGTTIFCAGLLNTRIWDAARARPGRFGGPAFQREQAGEFWRTHGMPVDWACEQAIDAVEAGRRYCSPVFQHVADEFDARNAMIRESFVVFPGAPTDSITATDD